MVAFMRSANVFPVEQLGQRIAHRSQQILKITVETQLAYDQLDGLFRQPSV